MTHLFEKSRFGISDNRRTESIKIKYIYLAGFTISGEFTLIIIFKPKDLYNFVFYVTGIIKVNKQINLSMLIKCVKLSQ